MKDDFGGTWARTGVGTYTYTSPGSFPDADKVHIMVGENASKQPDVNVFIQVTDSDTLTLTLTTSQWSGFSGLVTITPADGLIPLLPIFIRVYS